MRAELLERYQAIPLPTKSDEHWRFTDLAGFDPDSYTAAGEPTPPRRRRRCSRSTHPASRRSARRGSRSRARPRASASSSLTDDHPLLGTLVGHGEKFAAHNAAMWEHGLLVHVPKGVVVEKPIYVRIANAVEGGSLFWRLLIVAEAQSRFTVIEEYASARRSSPATRTRRSRSSSRRAPRSSTSRSRTSRRAPGTSRPTTRGSGVTRSSTGSQAASAPAAARSGSRTTSPGKERRPA